MMSPLQAVMSRARFEIMSHKQDFKAVGVSKEQIEKAAAKAGERVKQEFEQKEKEDPLRRIEQVLEETAETQEEKALAQAGMERLEAFRSGWADMIRRARQEAEYAGKPFDIREVVGKARWRNDPTPTFVDARVPGPGNWIEDYPGVTFLNILVTGDEQERIKPSDAFRERVLKRLGALKPDQKLSDLKLLPPDKEGFRGAVYRHISEYAERIPCQIQGVDLRVDFRWPGIHASMDLPTLEKIVDFPRS
ncbi:MAG TPA: hypothetical protein VMX76_02905 [Nevskiaceae bacterium]|nr:hypothetical protein [Nevskiaceae bacterium]